MQRNFHTTKNVFGNRQHVFLQRVQYHNIIKKKHFTLGLIFNSFVYAHQTVPCTHCVVARVVCPSRQCAYLLLLYMDINIDNNLQLSNYIYINLNIYDIISYKIYVSAAHLDGR